VKFGTSILLLLTFLNTIAGTQTSPAQTNTPPAYNGSSMHMDGVHIPPIPGASFFAKAELETTQTLADGGTVTHRTYNIIARDSRGRTHNENRVWTTTEGSEARLNYIVTFDLDAHARTFIYPATHFARQFILQAPSTGGPKDVKIIDPHPPTVQKEDLGTNFEDDLQLKGSRETRTYPPGVMGNDHPLVITNEYWYSPDLQLNITVKRTDPRFGTQIVHVVNLHREEPDPSLFEVPADYKLVNENGADTPDTAGGTTPASRIRLGGTVQSAQLINRVQPVYPMEARKERIQGTVRLHVIVQKDGAVGQLEVVSGHPLLQQAAVDAVLQWRYRPTLLNGEPVEVDTTIDVIFMLNTKPPVPSS